MDHFKLPLNIPQDLLLIQEYVGLSPSVSSRPASDPPSPAPNVSSTAVSSQNEDISSSDDDDDIASEEEVAADLIAGADPNTDDDHLVKISSLPL